MLRGDADLVGRQLAALAAADPDGEASEVFRLLMRRAAAMAVARQELAGAARAAMEQVLDRHG